MITDKLTDVKRIIVGAALVAGWYEFYIFNLAFLEEGWSFFTLFNIMSWVSASLYFGFYDEWDLYVSWILAGFINIVGIALIFLFGLIGAVIWIVVFEIFYWKIMKLHRYICLLLLLAFGILSISGALLC